MGASIETPPGSRFGTEYDDYLVGTDTSQLLYGYGGNDWLRGLGGGDYMEGGSGNDTLEGGYGNDRLVGGYHNDTADYFYANHGVIANLEFGYARTLGPGPVDNDTLESIENLSGSQFDDHFQGSELHNKLQGWAGNDVLMGWGGDDLLEAGFGADYVVGGDGQDRLSGGFDNDTLQGNNGNDTADYLYSYQGMYVSLADGSSRTLNSSYYTEYDSLSSIENIAGTYYDDILVGDANNNVLDGRDGNDDLQGGAGQDYLYGGAGIDAVNYRYSSNSVGIDLSTGYGTLGDAAWDRYFDMENIYGSNHASGDVLTGNDIANFIEANGGNDVVRARGGFDTVQGGSGIDFVDGGDGNDMINGGDHADTLDGGAGFDFIDFNPSFGGIDPVGTGVTASLLAGTASGLGNDGESLANFEGVIGTSFDDIIDGNNVANVIRAGLNQDRIRGFGGNDVIVGDDGNDSVNGGEGNDDLFGGRGVDVMTGGLNSDNFHFRLLSEMGSTNPTSDQILDFAKGLDKIVLADVDANSNAGGNQAFTYIGGDAFTAAGQLRSFTQGNSTVVQGEVNGNGQADFQIVLATVVDLSALDFVL